MPLFLLLAVLSFDNETAIKEPVRAPWGTVRAADGMVDTLLADVVDAPFDGNLLLPVGLPPVAVLYATLGTDRFLLPFELGNDAKVVRVQLPADFARRSPVERKIFLETAGESGQRSDGRIVFCAGDAKIIGTSARLESKPGQKQIGFWTDPADSVNWNYKATRPGMYDVELTYSLGDEAVSSIEIEMAEATIAAPLPSTQNWSRYTSMRIGRLYVPKAGEHRLQVRCTKKSGAAVMTLAAVTLRPACEGRAIAQDEDGGVTCHARDVTIRGVQVQYEPKPEKNTVGYWTIPGDRVTWEFALKTAGLFDVEILQGCGKGQGGSEVELAVDGQPLRFVVEDTGHFQNFIPRKIGQVRLEQRSGTHTILVRPLRKAGVAVMDLRQVRLVPVK